jgi:hypothetical protein
MVMIHLVLTVVCTGLEAQRFTLLHHQSRLPSVGQEGKCRGDLQVQISI